MEFIPEPFIDERVKRFGPLFLTHVYGEAIVFSVDSDFNQFILQDRLVRLNLDSWPELVHLLDETKKITFELTMKQQLSFDPSEWTERLRKEYALVIAGFSMPFCCRTFRKAVKARETVVEALGVVVRQRRREFEADDKKNDMLGALLEAGDCFSDEEIVDFLVSLFVAGYEATSTSMALAVKLLTDTPLALDQLKVEHAQIQAQKASLGTLEWDDYKSMPFTRCVVNETLRVGNIVAMVFRQATRDIVVGEGVRILLRCAYDARSFNPWRWQDMTGVSSIGNGTVFTPFGGGTRLCPGYELARVTISIFLHHLVTQLR